MRATGIEPPEADAVGLFTPGGLPGEFSTSAYVSTLCPGTHTIQAIQLAIGARSSLVLNLFLCWKTIMYTARLVASLAIFFVFLAGNAIAQSNNSSIEAFFVARIKPHYDEYFSCANSYLQSRARSEPYTSFEKIEGGLKPACGLHIDRARSALAGAGLTKAQQNSLIRSYYTGIQDRLRIAFDTAAQREHSRRDEVRIEARRQEQATAADAERRRQAAEIESQKKRLLTDVLVDHKNCINRNLIDILPHSNEGADVIATVVLAKCAEYESKMKSMFVALFNLPKNEAEKGVADVLGDSRKEILTLIVTLRTELSKNQVNQRNQKETGI